MTTRMFISYACHQFPPAIIRHACPTQPPITQAPLGILRAEALQQWRTALAVVACPDDCGPHTFRDNALAALSLLHAENDHGAAGVAYHSL